MLTEVDGYFMEIAKFSWPNFCFNLTTLTVEVQVMVLRPWRHFGSGAMEMEKPMVKTLLQELAIVWSRGGGRPHTPYPYEEAEDESHFVMFFRCVAMKMAF